MPKYVPPKVRFNDVGGLKSLGLIGAMTIKINIRLPPPSPQYYSDGPFPSFRVVHLLTRGNGNNLNSPSSQCINIFIHQGDCL